MDIYVKCKMCKKTICVTPSTVNSLKNMNSQMVFCSAPCREDHTRQLKSEERRSQQGKIIEVKNLVSFVVVLEEQRTGDKAFTLYSMMPERELLLLAYDLAGGEQSSSIKIDNIGSFYLSELYDIIGKEGTKWVKNNPLRYFTLLHGEVDWPFILDKPKNWEIK